MKIYQIEPEKYSVVKMGPVAYMNCDKKTIEELAKLMGIEVEYLSEEELREWNEKGVA